MSGSSVFFNSQLYWDIMCDTVRHSFIYSSPQKGNLIPISSYFPSPLNPTSWNTLTYFLFLWIRLFWTGIINRWSLWLNSFAEHNIFIVHPCCSMYQYFIPLCCQIVFHPIVCPFINHMEYFHSWLLWIILLWSSYTCSCVDICFLLVYI